MNIFHILLLTGVPKQYIIVSQIYKCFLNVIIMKLSSYVFLCFTFKKSFYFEMILHLQRTYKNSTEIPLSCFLYHYQLTMYICQS
jgi:hypothetical protein